MVAVPPPAPPARPIPARPVSGGPRRFASLRTVTALVLREMSTRYGRTPGGYLWAIAEPLGAIIVLSIGFSLVLRTPSLGTSFLLFYATGYLAFSLYNTVANTTARAINFSKPLLKYPAVTWIDAVLARFLLTSLTGIVIAIVLLSGILAVVDSHTTIDMVPVVEAFALAMLLGLGVGTTNCALMGLFPLWDVAWSIITRPLFLASAIIYIYEDLPPLAKEVLWYNPLIHITGLMRRGFYSTYTAAHLTPLYTLFWGLAFLALGLLLLGRYHREILNRQGERPSQALTPADQCPSPESRREAPPGSAHPGLRPFGPETVHWTVSETDLTHPLGLSHQSNDVPARDRGASAPPGSARPPPRAGAWVTSARRSRSDVLGTIK